MNKETVPSLKSDMTEEQLNVRERALLILLQEFGNEKSNRAIYACAEEWCNKQVNTNGLVSYYKAYYNQHGQT